MKRILLIIGIICFTSLVHAQSDCKCCSIEHKAFFFWEGDWVVYDTVGSVVGQNTVDKLQDGCVLRENWRSKSSTGTSYNYYNKSDSTWNQVWIDNQGGNLVLKGGLKNGKMVLRSELQPGKKVALYYNQITWIPNPNGTVTQVWNIYDENDAFLATLFKGIYKKK
jgi:hypothetical protein